MSSKTKKINKSLSRSELRSTTGGFTLIEMMVAVSIFTIIMTISMGSILAVFDANKKSQTMRTVMDNLNSTMESMTRTIRFGKTYHCVPTGNPIGNPSLPQDCPGGGDYLTLLAPNGSQVTFRLFNNRVMRSDGFNSYYITSPDVTITKLNFFVYGSVPYIRVMGNCPTNNDCFQPRVIMVISGYAGSKPTTQTSFSLETTISQRKFDFQ